jgi:hypothetical protein
MFQRWGSVGARSARLSQTSFREVGAHLSVVLAIAILSSIALVPLTHADTADADANVGYFKEPKYIGSAYCYACHGDLSQAFTKTKMGRLFQSRPRNDLERRGCEGCHGPGSNHAITGGGVGIGGLIEFRIDHGQSIEKANQACMNCHDEAFWHGGTMGTRRLACFDCHLVMTRMSRASQLAPPYFPRWRRGQTWGFAIIVGVVAGLFSGTFLRGRHRNSGEHNIDEPV